MNYLFQPIASSSISRIRTILFYILLLISTFRSLAQGIPERPNPPQLVNDLAGILSTEERAQLEKKLRAYYDSTSTQLVILIVKTTEPYPIGDYSFQVGRKWGVGQKGKNNGLVLTWATDTRSVFIATGYGLEGAIPDAIAKRIISQLIVPHFKNQEWFAGLNEATNEIIQRANGEFQTGESTGTDTIPKGLIIVIVIVFVIIMIIYFISRRGGNGGNNNRGQRGGGFFPFPYTTYSGGGGSSGNWGGGGSSFGGFGGGSFGGGGAGGNY